MTLPVTKSMALWKERTTNRVDLAMVMDGGQVGPVDWGEVGLAEAGLGEGGGGVDLVTLMGQNAELEQTGDPAAWKSQATGSSGRAGLVRHPSLPGGRGRTESLTILGLKPYLRTNKSFHFFSRPDPSSSFLGDN